MKYLLLLVFAFLGCKTDKYVSSEPLIPVSMTLTCYDIDGNVLEKKTTAKPMRLVFTIDPATPERPGIDFDKCVIQTNY